MTVARLPLAYDIATRDGTLTKDAKIVNAYSETVGQTKHIVKRPGIATLSTLPATGGSSQGQGMFYYNNQLYVVVANVLYLVNANGTYTTLGTMTGNQLQCYFNQTLPVQQSSGNTVTGNYSYVTAGTYSLTIPSGVFVAYASLSGGGGGGGYSIFSGDGHGAGNGSSGGYYSSAAFLIPGGTGMTLTIVVGAGGAASTSSSINGVAGSSSSVYNGSTNIFTATGGGGGLGVVGDNAPGASGAAGVPNGVLGSYTSSWMVNRNTAGQGYDGKGQNGTGYGSGGLGGNSNGPAQSTAGQSGYVNITF
jgi:hypothetical protein